MNKLGIKRGQIWINRKTNKRFLISGTHGGKWRAKTLDRTIADYHSLDERTLRTQFNLITEHE